MQYRHHASRVILCNIFLLITAVVATVVATVSCCAVKAWTRWKAWTAANGTPMTELRDVTCHVGSRSLTCYGRARTCLAHKSSSAWFLHAVIIIPHREMHARKWPKSSHVTFTESDYSRSGNMFAALNNIALSRIASCDPAHNGIMPLC